VEPTDLLDRTSRGALSIDDAYGLVDAATEAAHQGGPDWKVTLGFTDLEAKAFLHAASIEQLTRVRADGWPDRCSTCGAPIDADNDHWWFRSREDGVPELAHITCLQPSEDEASD
jgi:hypothetical protein